MTITCLKVTTRWTINTILDSGVPGDLPHIRNKNKPSSDRFPVKTQFSPAVRYTGKVTTKPASRRFWVVIRRLRAWTGDGDVAMSTRQSTSESIGLRAVKRRQSMTVDDDVSREVISFVCRLEPIPLKSLERLLHYMFVLLILTSDDTRVAFFCFFSLFCCRACYFSSHQTIHYSKDAKECSAPVSFDDKNIITTTITPATSTL